MSAEDVQAAVDQRFGVTSDTAPKGNEFVVFSKPELGRLTGENLDRVWDLISSALDRYDVTVHETMTLTGAELSASGVMADHYGVINMISRLGRSALTEAADAVLAADFAAELSGGAVVLGGHQFLASYPDFDAYSLGVLFASLPLRRLGPGSYAVVAKIDSQQVIVLNGFHPRQLSFFTAPDTVCAFLRCSSETSWQRLRTDLLGVTDPSAADADSIRGTLYADPAGFGLTAVTSNFNGVHMSAGPLEGLLELARFFGGSIADYTFATKLRSAGVSELGVRELAGNPTLTVDGTRGSAFDLSEGLDAIAAAELLSAALPAS